MRGVGVEIKPKDDTDHRRNYHQRYAQSADHGQTVEREFAGLPRHHASLFFIHSNIAFCMLDLELELHFAFCPTIRQVWEVAMSVEKVLLIRHGETDFNRERRLQGVMEIPLNERGREQAAAVANYLKDIPIDALYTSPILRARETAEIIGNVIGMPPSDDERLREIEFGVFEGLTFAEIKQRFPTAHRNWTTGYLAYNVPQGESRRVVQGRMRAAWEDLTAHSDHKTVALVSHGSAIAIFLGSLYALLPDSSIKNTSITTLEYREPIWEIAGYAQTPHMGS